MPLPTWMRRLFLRDITLFGCGRSTVCLLVNEVTQAIVDVLWEEHVLKHFPKNQQQFKEKMLDMEELWQFPCCCAALDGCHIPRKCPDGGLAACSIKTFPQEPTAIQRESVTHGSTVAHKGHANPQLFIWCHFAIKFQSQVFKYSFFFFFLKTQLY